MQVSHWSSSDVTCNRSIMFLSSQQDAELQRTPVRRHNKSASRKNLSRSFSQILNEECGEEGDKEEAQRMLPLIHSEFLGCERDEEGEDGDDEVFVKGRRPFTGDMVEKKRLLVRTRSAQASDSNYRTDSGFNDDDLTINSARSVGHSSFSTPSSTKNQVVHQTMRTTTAEDVPMRSVRCDR